MAINFTKHSEEIRKICQDYYYRNISQKEFQDRRNSILDNIENEMFGQQSEPEDSQKENIMDMVRSCIKKLNPIE